MGNDIKNEERIIATKPKIDDIVHKLHNQQAFITVKYDKDNFSNSPQFRLLNCS